MKDLAARIQVLEGKVKQLEAKSGSLGATPNVGPGNLPPRFRLFPWPPSNPPAALLPGHPRIWGQGECNGWPYYLIPLAASASAPDR